MMVHNRSPVILWGLDSLPDYERLLEGRVYSTRFNAVQPLSFGPNGQLYKQPYTGFVPREIFFPPGSIQFHFSRETGELIQTPATVLPVPEPRVSSTCCAWSHKLNLYDATGLLEEGMIHYDRNGWPAASRWGSEWFELVYSRPTL